MEARHPLEARRPGNLFFLPHPHEFRPHLLPHNVTNKTAIEYPQPEPRTMISEGLEGPRGRCLRISREGSTNQRFEQVKPRAQEKRPAITTGSSLERADIPQRRESGSEVDFKVGWERVFSKGRYFDGVGKTSCER